MKKELEDRHFSKIDSTNTRGERELDTIFFSPDI